MWRVPPPKSRLRLTLDVFARICVTHGGGGDSGDAEGEGGDGIPASATVAAQGVRFNVKTGVKTI